MNTYKIIITFTLWILSFLAVCNTCSKNQTADKIKTYTDYYPNFKYSTQIQQKDYLKIEYAVKINTNTSKMLLLRKKRKYRHTLFGIKYVPQNLKYTIPFEYQDSNFRKNYTSYLKIPNENIILQGEKQKYEQNLLYNKLLIISIILLIMCIIIITKLKIKS